MPDKSGSRKRSRDNDDAGGSSSKDSRPSRRRRSRFAPAAPGASVASVAAALNQSVAAAAATAAARAQAEAAARAQAIARAAAASAAAPVPPGASAGVGAGAAAAGGAAVEAAKRAAQIQAALAAVASAKQLLARQQGAAASGGAAAAPAPSLVLDNQGRQVDASGRVVGFRAVTTLAVNRSSRRSSRINPYLSMPDMPSSSADPLAKAPKLAEGPNGAAGLAVGDSAGAGAGAGAEEADEGKVVVTRGDTFDPRMKVGGRRARGSGRSFKFAEPGKFIKAAEAARAREERRAALELARAPGTRHAPRTHGDLDASDVLSGVAGENANLIAVGRRRDVLPDRPSTTVPDVEWWDAEFLPPDVREQRKLAAQNREAVPEASYDKVSAEHSVTLQGGLVELPVPVQSANKDAAAEKVAVPLMLTKRERKRLRRQTRAARLKEQRDKVALRLVPAPEPKVKLKNMMRVMGQQAVLDPTQVEAHVRSEMEKRQRNHEMRNLARKLTPAERKQKVREKLTAHSGAGTEVAVFRVKDLTNKQHMYKVDVNAQQLYLKGCVLYSREAGLNLVVVEGGLKGVKKFVRLMTKRINWSAKPGGDDESSDSDSDNEGAAGTDNFCHLVWRGVVPKAAFTNFRFEECNTSKAARKLMATRGVGHYWDMVETGVGAAGGPLPPPFPSGST